MSAFDPKWTCWCEHPLLRRASAETWLGKNRIPTDPLTLVNTDGAAPGALASALLFVQSRIGFIRRRLDMGAPGLAQRSFLVSLPLFFLAPSACRPRSLGSISSLVWLKCHHVPRWLITHLSGAHASCGASFREKLIDVSRRFSNSALSL